MMLIETFDEPCQLLRFSRHLLSGDLLQTLAEIKRTKETPGQTIQGILFCFQSLTETYQTSCLTAGLELHRGGNGGHGLHCVWSWPWCPFQMFPILHWKCPLQNKIKMVLFLKRWNSTSVTVNMLCIVGFNFNRGVTKQKEQLRHPQDVNEV